VLLMCHDAARCIHRQIFPTCDSTNNKKYSWQRPLTHENGALSQ
jgi:hypothetical protein